MQQLSEAFGITLNYLNKIIPLNKQEAFPECRCISTMHYRKCVDGEFIVS